MKNMQTVLDFWFGNETDDALVAKTQAGLWWSKNEAADTLVRERFAALTDLAAAGELDDWLDSAQGCLALIILCDQFPRNMYRNTQKSFAFDHLAKRFCLAGLSRQFERQLRPVQKVFFYLPLEHSEILADQERSVVLFNELNMEQAVSQPGTFDGFYQYALRHREVIQRFGRFPHRNASLGRVSTPEELQFLSEPGSSF